MPKSVIYEVVIGGGHLGRKVFLPVDEVATPRGRISELRYRNDGKVVAAVRLLWSADRDVELELSSSELRATYKLWPDQGPAIVVGETTLFDQDWFSVS